MPCRSPSRVRRCRPPDHIAEVLQEGPSGGHASAALLASLLHDGVLTVEQIKQDLLVRGLMIRP